MEPGHYFKPRERSSGAALPRLIFPHCATCGIGASLLGVKAFNVSEVSGMKSSRWPNGPLPAELQRIARAFARRGRTLPGAIDEQWLAFHPAQLRGKAVLDIGCGTGFASVYAVASGAAHVVALEPEASGSTPGAAELARELHNELGYGSRITLVEVPLQSAQLSDDFDLVLVNAAINHFDEDCCSRLHLDAEARHAYRPLLRRLADLCKPGGRLVVIDCSRRNFFADVGIRSPLMKRIDWRIHQPPEIWVELLTEAGFSGPNISWLPLSRKLGLAPILSRRWVAYFLNSVFRLEMKKARSDGCDL